MENYNINDAFKALEGLNEDIFSADDKGIEELRSFYDGDTDFEAEDIVDVEAKTKEDLKDSYVGHVILRCPICTTLIYKLPKEVILDEDTAYVNVGEECPVCSSVDGWDIVGQVVDFDKESLNVEDEDDGEESDSDVKIKVDDEEVITESKHKRFKKLKEAYGRDTSLRRSITAALNSIDHPLNRNEFTKLADYLVDYYRSEGWDLSQDGDGPITADDIISMIDAGDDEEFRALGDKWLGLEEEEDATSLTESTGSDLAKYQKWVDYDMKRYGKISDITNDKLKRAGLEVVKDDHGDYEVISREDNGKTLTEEKNSDKLKKRFPEYFKDTDIKARYKKDNHSRKMFKEALGTIYDAVLKILDDNGYDVEDSEVKEYANSAAEYIEMTRAETDGKYSVYRWFKDTKSNYPEELTGLKKLNESVDSVEVKTDKEEIEVDSDEDGKTTVEVKPREEEDVTEGEETIVPVDDETKDEIEDNSIKVSDIDIDEFDEDEFDELEEKYLQKVYENVKSYKTTKGTIRGNKLILEGVIEFNSGKKVPTKNIFESAYRLKNGKLKFNGLNEQFSKNSKAFTLTGSLSNKKLIIESLNYNYSAKDNKSGKTQRIYGTIKK